MKSGVFQMKQKVFIIISACVMVGLLILPFLPKPVQSGRYLNHDNLLMLLVFEDNTYQLVPGVVSISYSGHIEREGNQVILISDGRADARYKEGDRIATFIIKGSSSLILKASALPLMKTMIDTTINRED